ncbi:hypothetical protein N7495_007128 [Penicillium taxi]|uniref:uncharacterized protein n=1 Tax=Penicillium taxi TaxID=168475 RepID=UPI0025454B73|nr:uncharacterized protein N7495_007128 [Penicillium taxi]KAJ5895437.1 hypothetical protein N7495_007128 [Penicillium taxi]
MAQANLSSASSSSCSLLHDLPSNYVIRTFSTLKQVSQDVDISKNLEDQEDANQFLVLLGLNPRIIHQLDESHRHLFGANFRFEWEGSVGVIKIVPCNTHEVSTERSKSIMDTQLIQMDIIRPSNRRWVGTTSYTSTNSGKQPDQAFVPLLIVVSRECVMVGQLL